MDHQEQEIVNETVKHAFLRNVGAVLTAMMPVCLALVVWGAGINERMREHDVKIANLERSDERMERMSERERTELLIRLDRLSSQIEELQKTLRAK